jgi:hypothetical protein
LTQRQIGAEVRHFVSEYIRAPEQLDILLLLHSHPERQMTAAEISRAVFTVPAAATMRLEGMVESGLLVSSGGADPRYGFNPSSAGLRARVDELAAAYRTNRVAVIGLIFQRPPDPLKSFSDAFRIRKEE